MVGAFNPFDPVDAENNDKDALGNIDAQKKLQKTVTPQQAQAVSQIYKNAPWIPPRVILDLAKTQPTQEAIDAVGKVAANQYIQQNMPNKPDTRSWFERNVYDKAKAVSRWTFAALQFAPDVAQNVASQVFSGNDPAGIDGWFASTQLGALASGQNAGTGFFIGDEAAKTQAQKAREFRGTINGHAWTIGRGAADVFFTPGSREYSLLSGFVDAATQIYADPTMYLGQAFKAAKTGEEVKGLIGTKKISQAIANQMVERGLVVSDVIPKVTGEVAAAAAKVARGEAGLQSAEMATFKQSGLYSWFERNPKAKRMAERISGFAKSATDEIATKGLKDVDAQRERAKVAAKIIQDFPPGTIDIETALKFAEADDVLKVQARLAEAQSIVGEGATYLPRQIGDVAGVGATQKLRERIPLYRTIMNSRWMSDIPTETSIVIGTSESRTRAIGTFDRFLKGMGLHTSQAQRYENFMADAVMALSQSDVAQRSKSMDELYANFLDFITEGIGGDKNVVRAAYNLGKEEMARIRSYAVNEAGQVTDGGAFQMMREFLNDDQLEDLRRLYPEDQLDNLQFSDPQMLVQLIDNMYVLPDFRKFRGLSENAWMKGVLRGAKGDQNKILAAAEEFQNEIWKPAILATGGYIVRNMIDSHIRIAANGYSGFFSHPFQFIQTVLGKRFVGALTGADGGIVRTFEDMGPEFARDYVDNVLVEHANSASGTVYRNLKDPLAANERLWRNEHFANITRAADKEAYISGYVDNMGQIRTDPITSKLVEYWDLPPAERNKKVLDWLKSEEGSKARETILSHYKNGRVVVDPKSGRRFVLKFGQAPDDALLANWISTSNTAQVSDYLRAGDATKALDPDMRFITQHDRVPLLEDVLGASGEVIDVRVAGLVEQPADAFAGAKVGQVVSLGDNAEGVIVQIEPRMVPDPFNPGEMIDRPVAKIQPVESGPAFTKAANDPALLGTDNMRRFINWKAEQGLLKTNVKVAQRIAKDAPGNRGKIGELYDGATRWFFQNIAGVAQQKLERSPLWRQAFYKHVAENANLLSPAEQQLLKNNIDQFVLDLKDDVIRDGKKPINITAEDYVGGKDIYNKIFGKVATGDATVAELERYGGRIATREVQRILYDAHQKNNLEDMLRVLAPFATAFRETLTKYSRYMIEDPSRIRKTQLVFNAVNYNSQNPDDLFHGWFQKDAVTGKHVFNLPVGGWVGPLLQFPIKGGFQIANVPGFGPAVQIAASEIMPDTPKLDFVRKMILPYGEQGASSLVPQWARRGIEALRADTTNMDTIYGTTYGDTVKYLVQSGQYDLTDPNEAAKLYADAKGKARILAGLRALFQFSGPTTPTVDFRLETDGGDIIASSLSQEYYRLRSENPDTAVEQFIKTFGEPAFAYLGSKTEAIAGGLEPTEAFGKWQRENGDLFEQYKQVAGYFAPGGDDFSFETYNRQLKKGQRRRLTAAEMVAGAQYRIGMAIYRSKRDMLGDTLTDDQRTWLADWRKYISSKYPGFPEKAQFNPGEFDSFVSELRTAVSDERLANNEVADAVRQYLDARDKALANAGAANLSSLSAQRAAPLRDWLSGVANTLIRQTPEFARIFDDKLSSEVD